MTPVLQLLLHCLLKERQEQEHSLWKTPVGVSMVVSPSFWKGVSVGGVLIDFATLLLTANWESDCRATVPPLILPQTATAEALTSTRDEEDLRATRLLNDHTSDIVVSLVFWLIFHV